MVESLDELQSRLQRRYKASGQDHVLQHVSELSYLEKASFLRELDEINVENLTNLLHAARDEKLNGSDHRIVIEPFQGGSDTTVDKEFVEKSNEIGINAIKEGKVCALVLAGGQGTRLGFSGPKGLYPLLQSKTLFQILAERILKLQLLAGGDRVIPWYIMTSPMNHDQTIDFFQQNQFFGLKEENVILFRQGVLPCLDFDGKIILQSKSKCAMAPDGNGGIYISMKNNLIFEDMRRRKIEYIHVFSIDNALVKPADPVFIGSCITNNADCGNKVLWKRDASEKVGIVASKNGKPCIVEYSDMEQKLLEKVDENGKLVYGAANICNHFFTLDFLQYTVLSNLDDIYHIAKKKIPYWDSETNSTISPITNNGMKLESFIFDVFPLSSNMSILQVLREEEFAPVKNAPGSSTDSPDQAKEMMSNLAKKWIREAGVSLGGIVESNECEISPLTSYAGEGLTDVLMIKNIRTIKCPFHI